MAYTRNPTWVDGGPGVGTRIDAVDLENIETGLVTAANVADTALANAATAQSGANASVKKLNDLSDISNPTAALANLGGVPTSRIITAGSGLSGGGDLTANRTLAVVADAGLPSQTGNSGKFLTTNGSASSWATASGGGVATRVPKVNSYMGPGHIIAGAAGSASFGTGAVPFVEFVIGQAISIDQLGFRVMTAEAAMNAKVLLYSSDSDGYPATLIKDSGALSCASANVDVLATFSNLALSPGRYWATIRSNSGSTVRFLACTQSPSSVIATTTTNVWQAVTYLSADPGTYASPNSTISSWSDGSTTGSNAVMPVIFMRRSV